MHSLTIAVLAALAAVGYSLDTKWGDRFVSSQASIPPLYAMLASTH